jgi:hypothetical protein
MYAGPNRFRERSILRGEAAGHLPAQSPDKFELVINLKSAKALSLSLRQSLLLLADEVIGVVHASAGLDWLLANTGSCSHKSGLSLIVAPAKRIIAEHATREMAMSDVVSRFARLSVVTIVATAFLGGAATMPAFAQATKLSKADQAALRHAIASCKSEAKAKKVKLLSRRQYVVDCVQALKDRPQVNVPEVLRNHPDLKGLPCHPNPDPGYKLAC